MNGQFDSDRIAQIQKELQLRETEDLLEIWQAHDEKGWTPEAFEAMRRILRERLGEEPPRPTMEYFCSECGAQVSLTDRFCPACGANVEELEEAAEDDSAEPGLPSQESGRVLTLLELAFFSEVDRLPEEYAGYLAASEDEVLVIPAREPKVGELKVRFLNAEIIVTIGQHTQSRFRSAREAVEFIQDVLEGNVVFQFDEGQVEVCRISDLTEAEKMEWDNYVWTGPLRNKLTGMDWYRP